jgi:hypothetical protein
MKRLPLLLILPLFVLAHEAQAQCRTFVKNNCREAMGEYIPAENFNAAKLSPADEAEVQMTFYGGEDYRLLVCSQEILGDVNFQILDTDGNVLFDNADQDMVNTFDFRAAGTQEFIIRLKVSENENVALNPQGCVAIMVGKKVNDQ